MNTRWADLPVIRDTESGIAAIEREQMTKPRPLDIEEPTFHQPSVMPQHIPNEIYQRETNSIDEITVQSIKLIQYCRQLRVLIQGAKQQVEAVKSGELKACIFSPVPPVPLWQEPVLKQRILKPIPFLQKDVDSSFVRGVGAFPPEIGRVTCKRLMRRSIAVVCAHASFDGSMESCLDTLSDVLHNYFVQMSQLLRAAVDNDASCVSQGAGGFSDVICKVFYEMGIGSPTVLHNYYQSYVIDYHVQLILKCQQLHQEYVSIVHPDGAKSASGQTLVSWKEGSIGDIQFPSTDENDEVGYCDQMPVENLDANATHEMDSLVAVEEDTGGRFQTRSRQNKQDHDDRQSTS